VERKNIVGTRIRQTRKNANPPVTQLDLVARLQLLDVEMNQSSLSKIEGGQRPVSDIEVAAFAKALKVPVAWLFKEPDNLQ
jgi:transcriptional regulator with XRE-family HTH domain